MVRLWKIYMLFLPLELFASSASKTITLRIADNKSGYTDYTTIYFDNGTSPVFTTPEDAQKIHNNSPLTPEIYSYSSDSVPCLFNEYGPFSSTTTVALGTEVDSSGTFRIYSSAITNFDSTSLLLLEDRELGNFFDLRNGNYVFQSTTTEQNIGRFFLHITAPVVTSTVDAGCNNNDGSISVSTDPTISWSACELFDANMNFLSSYFNVSGNFSFSNLPWGNYHLKFSYDSYSVERSVAITGHQIIVNAGASTDTGVVNQTIYFSITAPNATNYFWDFGDGTTISAVSNPDMFYPITGTFMVTVYCSNSYGCTASDSFPITILAALSVLEISLEDFLITVENKTLRIVSNQNAVCQMHLYNINGELLQNNSFASSVSLNLSSLANGIYIVEIRSGKEHLTKKIVLR